MFRYGLFFLSLLTMQAMASGYSDYVRGISAATAGRSDLAIESFSSALSAGDLAPIYVPLAHIKRGWVYMRSGKCREGLADADAALKLQPKNQDVLLLHASANSCLGHRAAAKADCDALLALHPRPGIYDVVARYQWESGEFANARDNFEISQNGLSKKSTHKLYVILWYAMSAARAGTLDAKRLEKMADRTDVDDWPWPLLEFYLGETDRDAVYREAEDGEPVPVMQKICEADFYLGEWKLVGGDVDGALPLFRKAAEKCPKSYVERSMAEIELKRLEKSPEKTAEKE